jgi:hypothetical protein
MISDLVNLARFLLGFVLIVISLRAYSKSRSSAMLFLVLGFSSLTLGDFFSAIYFTNNVYLDNLISDAFDIPGFIALIIAVGKS